MDRENTNGIEQTENSKKKSIIQFIKFALFSSSAGLIQIISFTLLNEIVIKLPFIHNLMEQSPVFAKIMQNEYGPIYLIALILSVLWNFTINRKFTFKSATNIPIAMLKILCYYAVFTPLSTMVGNYVTERFADVNAIRYIALAAAMSGNMITEFMVYKFWVFRGSENTAEKKEEETSEK